MHRATLFSVLVLSAAPGAVHAFEFRARWVQRVGAVDVPIPLMGGVQTFVVFGFQSSTFRLQFGVFDDAGGPAPAGGFLGWNGGTIDATGGITSQNTRVSPFTFASGGNGILVNPDVTGIDATQGPQPGIWDWDDATQMPGPPPQANIYGLNTFVDVFSIHSDPLGIPIHNYSVTASGNVVAASGWNVIGGPPDESNPHVMVFMVPEVAGAPTPFTQRLDILIHPAPGAASLLGLAGLVAFRRRSRIARVTHPSP